MRREDYPPQTPLPAFALDYGQAAWRAADAVPHCEFSYGPDPHQRVAWVAPPQPNGAVLVFFHGGGWTCGYKEWNLLTAPAFVERQIGFASVGYRLAPQVTFPANLHDCAAGVAAVWHKLQQDGVRLPRLYLGGHSAGGHLASLLALNLPLLAHHGVPAEAVCGCVPVSGVFQVGEGSGLSQRPRFLGPTPDPDPDTDRAASPIHQIGPHAPPFFVTWGTRDFPHLITQAHAMCAALNSAGIPVVRHEIEGADHFDTHLATGKVKTTWTGLVVDWMGDPVGTPPTRPQSAVLR